MNLVTALALLPDDAASITLAIKREWDAASAAFKIAEDELALCCDKRVLNAGIRARRMMRAAARSLRTCVILSRRHTAALRAEERKNRSKHGASKQSSTF